jgi:UDP:flavonoid glycosyltransferase YjiC (YdhE family)
VRGVPVVVVPQGADQFLHGQRVSALGVGVALPGNQQCGGDLRAALADVLTTPDYAEAARTMAAATALLPDVDQAIAAIEDLPGKLQGREKRTSE